MNRKQDETERGKRPLIRLVPMNLPRMPAAAERPLRPLSYHPVRKGLEKENTMSYYQERREE